GYLVSNDRFYVRNHCPTPRIDVRAWRLHVDGPGVSNPLRLTYDELLQMPSTSVIRAIECAGNARSMMAAAHGSAIPGTPWKLGAIGVAEWTGVPLKDILGRAGLLDSAVDVMIHGLDAMKVNRPIPVAKALEEDTLLAY